MEESEENKMQNSSLIAATESTESNGSIASRQEIIAEYAKNVQDQKNKMMDNMSKQEMVDLIFKQDNLLKRQSSQMLDVVNLANNIETSARKQESSKCDISKKLNEKCQIMNDIQQQRMSLYESSVRIQIVLFVLLILVLVWLFYNYFCKDESATKTGTKSESKVDSK